MSPTALSNPSLTSTPTPEPPIVPPGSDFPVQQHTLDNGLRIWLQPDPTAISTTALLLINVGARSETSDINGISHFLEHMVFTGTEKWDELEIERRISRQGGHWNAWTGWENTTYYAQTAASDLSIALEWLSQVVFRPTLPEDKVERERKVIFQEKSGRYGWILNHLNHWGFGYNLNQKLRQVMFPDSTLGWTIIGEDQALDNINRDKLQAYYDRHYVPGNATLVVAGNTDLNTLKTLAQQYFGLIPAQTVPPQPPTPVVPQPRTRPIIVRGFTTTDQVKLQLVARTVGWDHPDRWPLTVLAEILDQQLMEELRTNQGLVYGVGAWNASYRDVGYWEVSTSVSRKNKNQALTEIEAHLERQNITNFTETERVEAKNALIGRWALSMESSYSRASWLSNWASNVTDITEIPNYRDRIQAVTQADLERVWDTYLQPQQRYLGMHLPLVTVHSAVRWGAIGLGGFLLGVLTWYGLRYWG
ncbi:MAG: M16 family metallopeptidase [Prochlorothrix sp.]